MLPMPVRLLVYPSAAFFVFISVRYVLGIVGGSEVIFDSNGFYLKQLESLFAFAAMLFVVPMSIVALVVVIIDLVMTYGEN